MGIGREEASGASAAGRRETNMADDFGFFSSSESGAAEVAEEDPAAAFLAQQESEIAGIENDEGFSTAEGGLGDPQAAEQPGEPGKGHDAPPRRGGRGGGRIRRRAYKREPGGQRGQHGPPQDLEAGSSRSVERGLEARRAPAFSGRGRRLVFHCVPLTPPARVPVRRRAGCVSCKPNLSRLGSTGAFLCTWGWLLRPQTGHRIRRDGGAAVYNLSRTFCCLDGAWGTC